MSLTLDVLGPALACVLYTREGRAAGVYAVTHEEYLPGRHRRHLAVDPGPGVEPAGPAERLALEVLAGSADAVWPLIDSIVEARDRPGLPTYAELLAALRERVLVLDDKPSPRRTECHNDNNAAVRALVARCEGVPV